MIGSSKKSFWGSLCSERNTFSRAAGARARSGIFFSWIDFFCRDGSNEVSHAPGRVREVCFIPHPGTHWAKMGLWIPFWWTFQNCILIILGHSWPFLTGKSTLRFSLKYIEMSEKLLWSWWKLEILENFKILFNTLIIICPYISLARICPWKSNLDQQKYIFFTNFWL